MESSTTAVAGASSSNADRQIEHCRPAAAVRACCADDAPLLLSLLTPPLPRTGGGLGVGVGMRGATTAATAAAVAAAAGAVLPPPVPAASAVGGATGEGRTVATAAPPFPAI
jgi:hypothetical protein